MNQSQKPKSMQELMTYYDNTIDMLNIDIEVLKEENERLQKIIDERARGQTVSLNDGLISRGQEADLYPNEVREILMDVLKAARSNIVKDGTRRADVVDDILKANPPCQSTAGCFQRLRNHGRFCQEKTQRPGHNLLFKDKQPSQGCLLRR